MKKNLLLFAVAFAGTTLLAQTPRLSLYEEFTGETCPPCASTNPGLNALLSSPTNTPKIIAIKWQVPIPSAPSNTWSLYQTDKADIDWRWRSSSYPGYGYSPAINSAPSSKIDGQEATVFGASSGHPANLNSTVISNAQAVMSPFAVTMNRAWDATGSAVIVTVNIQASMNYTATGALMFRTVMVERLITFSVQPGTNGEKTFEDPVIAAFPTTINSSGKVTSMGQSIPTAWTNGQTHSFTLSCTIPAYVRNKGEIAMVGFIQDDGNQKIQQAVRADKTPLTNDAVAVSANVNATCSNTISPNVNIMNNGANAITAMTITPYIDGAAGTPYTWTGNLAASASTVLNLGTLNTPTTAGAHTFSYNITAMNASDFNMNNNSAKITYVVASSYQGNPVGEGFTVTAFPPAGFTVINPNSGTASWSRVTNTGGYMLTNNAAKYDFFNNVVIGDKDEFILPPIDLSGSSVPELDFDIAYAQRGGSNDKLEIFVSDDCGSNWTSVFMQSGTALTITNPMSSAYTPNSTNDWRTESVYLTGFAKQVLVKFVTTSDNGNNLYLDNINLYQLSPATGIKNQLKENAQLAVYPNPANDQLNVRVNADGQQTGKISVMNNLGQVMVEKTVALNSGVNVVKLDLNGYSTGVYSVIVTTNKGTSVRKVTVNK